MLCSRLADLGLIDQYHLYLRTVILGHGTPFFAAPRPPLRLTATQNLGENMVRLTYLPD